MMFCCRHLDFWNRNRLLDSLIGALERVLNERWHASKSFMKSLIQKSTYIYQSSLTINYKTTLTQHHPLCSTMNSHNIQRRSLLLTKIHKQFISKNGSSHYISIATNSMTREQKYSNPANFEALRTTVPNQQKEQGVKVQ